MPIPDYQAIMLPLLQVLEDGREHQSKEVRDRVARHFHLSEDELKTLQPSGRMPLYNNRFHWARLYLDKAGVLSTPRRGWYRITSRGDALLRERPAHLDAAYLMRYPELLEFLKQGSSQATPRSATEDTGTKAVDYSPAVVTAQSPSSATPDEALEKAYWSLRRAVESELLDQVLNASPQFFEELVIKLLVAMGYGGTLQDAGKAIGRTGDGGIDGMIKEDKLGLDVIYIQAKRWQNTVGAKEIRDFAGSLDGEQARKGIFLTTSSFSRDSLEYVKKSPKRIVLIDGVTLASLMFDHAIGVNSEALYEVKSVNTDFFAED